MASWVLIIVILGGYSGGATSPEFVARDACEVARDSIKKHYKSTFVNVYAECFPKGQVK